MKIHMANGCIYDIPKDVKYANSSIAFSNAELLGTPRCVDIRAIKREIVFRKSEDVLKGFAHIGYEEMYRRGMSLQIEMHWFIDNNDLNKYIVPIE